MALIHPEIEDLLAILDGADLSWLADTARSRLNDLNDPRLGGHRFYERESDLPRDEDFLFQRDIVGTVVADVISRELSMRKQIRGAMEKLDLRSVDLLSGTRSEVFAIADDLSSREREDALLEFLNAWRTVIADLGGQPGVDRVG